MGCTKHLLQPTFKTELNTIVFHVPCVRAFPGVQMKISVRLCLILARHGAWGVAG